ncbi:hypothetical protein ES703_47874 [subsurface metagenome]
MDSKTKIRIALTSVTILFLILIGYFMITDYRWTVEALIIGSFAFFGTFTISSYSALFATLLIFGIFVLPFVINELGILDNYPDEPPDADVERGYTIEKAEESFDRFSGFLKRQFGSINKIKNYTLPIEITSAILGGCLIGLAQFFLIDSQLIWNPKTETWVVEEYYGFIRGQLLLIGILLLAIGLILIIRYIRRNPQSTIKKNSKPVSVQASPKVR